MNHPQNEYAGVLYPQEDYEAYIEEVLAHEEEVHSVISIYKKNIVEKTIFHEEV